MRYFSQLFLLLFLPILLVNCDLSKSEEFEESYTYSFQKDKQLAIDTTSQKITEDSTQTILNVSLQSGDHLVFDYEKRVTPPPTVMDGGSITRIYFQLPTDTKEFAFEGKELVNANLYFTRSCFCPIIGALKVENGVLEGQKLSDNVWSISASLQPKGLNTTYDVQFNDAFILNANKE